MPYVDHSWPQVTFDIIFWIEGFPVLDVNETLSQGPLTVVYHVLQIRWPFMTPDDLWPHFLKRRVPYALHVMISILKSHNKGYLKVIKSLWFHYGLDSMNPGWSKLSVQKVHKLKIWQCCTEQIGPFIFINYTCTTI